MPEDYAYDADGTRVSRKRGNVTTIYLGGLVEQEGTTTRTHYVFGGQVIAQREGSTVIYLHGDHLGSISVVTSSSSAVLSTQEYTPWGGSDHQLMALGMKYWVIGRQALCVSRQQELAIARQQREWWQTGGEELRV